MVDTCVNHRLTCLCPKETEAAPLAWILRWLYLLEFDSAHGIRPTPVAGPPTRLHGDRKYEEAPEGMLRRAAPGRVGPPRGRWRRRALCADDSPRRAPQIAVAGDLARISRRCTCGLRSTFRPRVRGQGAQEGGVRGSRRERSTYGVAGSLEGDPEGKRVGDPHGGGPALGRNAADKNLVPLGTQGPDGRGGVAQDELEVGVLLVSARSMSRNAMCSTPGGTCWRPSRHREMTAETPSGSCSSASTSPSQTPSSNGCRASAFLPVYAV